MITLGLAISPVVFVGIYRPHPFAKMHLQVGSPPADDDLLVDGDRLHALGLWLAGASASFSRTGDSSFSVAEVAVSVVPCWGHQQVVIHSIDLAS